MKEINFKSILFSVVLVVLGILFLYGVYEAEQAGAFASVRRETRRIGSLYLIGVLIVCYGFRTFYRGMKGKGFSLHKQGGFLSDEIYCCPHCGCNVQQGAQHCSVCGKRL